MSPTLLPIEVSPFWASNRPSSLNDDSKESQTNGHVSRHQVTPVPGRLHTQTMVNLITSLGWIINKKKSELTSVQVFCFMGYQQHLDTGLVRPTEDRWLKLCQLIQIIDVLNWIVGLHRKDGSRREPPHEALSMASQGILEDSSVTGLAPSLVHVDSSETVAQSSKCPKMIRAPPEKTTISCSLQMPQKKAGVLT